MLGRLGLKNLILTNAAGGINPAYHRGLLVLLNDHINLQGANPLTGPNDDQLGPRFPDMSHAYSTALRELAKQTASATEDISQKIETIQNDTKGAVVAIDQISKIINEINNIQTTIASAVEEQTATTNEIARNASEAAKGSTEISKNITNVSEAARNTTEGANNTLSAATELSKLSNELKRVVDMANKA